MKREILLNWRIYFAVPLAVAWLHASLNYSGFCFRKMRYLSDREKFRIVFEALNFKDTVRIQAIDKDNMRFSKYYELVKYESFEEFMEANPDCCAIVPGKSRNTPWESRLSYFWDRVTGYNSGEVIVMNFTFHYLDENGEQRAQEATIKSVLKNCGNLRRRLRTFPIDGLDYYFW